ncbi:MAG TPA: hypothetical protein VH540_12900 [Ktedonobacterales bacterium]|jgi:hypothetical protein
MLATLTDPLILLILALLLAQSLTYLIGGLSALRRPTLSKSAEARARRELVEWGLLDAKQSTVPPDRQALLRAWARLTAQSRVGMGVGILLAVALLLALLSIPGSAALLGSSLPPIFLLALLLLQAFYLGMFAGQAAALVWGGTKATRLAPTGRDAGGSPKGGTASFQPRPLSAYRSRQVALLPGAVLLGDVLLVGLTNRLLLPGLPPTELWCLILLPAAMALVCLGGEYATRRIARLPALTLADDPTLAHLADGKLRAHLMGMLLELEVFGLFILVGSQWMLRAFGPASSNSGLATSALLVYAVIIISLRGLLERSQRDRG